jgi:hypothetical protein
MANLTFDYSNNSLFQRNKTTKTYVYKDIGTDNFRLNSIRFKFRNPEKKNTNYLIQILVIMIKTLYKQH